MISAVRTDLWATKYTATYTLARLSSEGNSLRPPKKPDYTSAAMAAVEISLGSESKGEGGLLGSFIGYWYGRDRPKG